MRNMLHNNMRNHNPKKVMWACALGNGLELYDFTLYGVFSAIIAQYYFPATDPQANFFAGLTALSIGYFARPLGALIYGHLGDKMGRKVSLVASMSLMAISTGTIGLCPSYEQIGIYASVILFLARLLQGLCAGGEISGSSVFLIEHGSNERSSFSSAIIFVSGGLGCLIALCLGGIFIDIDTDGNLWRIPFLIGAVIGMVALYLRKNVAESPQFIDSEIKNALVKSPVLKAIQSYPIGFVKSILCGGFSGTMSATVIVFINLYLNKTISYPLENSIFLSANGLVAFVTASFLCSRVKSTRMRDAVIIFGALGVFFGVYPAFYLLNTGITLYVILAQLILGTFAGCFVSLINSYMSDLFPAEVRYSGLGLGYNIGYALCAGCLPLASFKLIELTASNYAPVACIMFMSFVGAIAVVYKNPSFMSMYPMRIKLTINHHLVKIKEKIACL